LVSDGPTRVALRHCRAVEREPCPRGANRMGVYFLLDVLAGADDSDGRGVVVVGIISMEHLAGRFTSKRQRGRGDDAIRSMT